MMWCDITSGHDMIWYDTIWYHLMWCDVISMIWYGIIISYNRIWRASTPWYDMLWYDIRYDMISWHAWHHDMISYDGMIWHYDMLCSHDMICYAMTSRYDMIWYDMIWYDMIRIWLLSALWRKFDNVYLIIYHISILMATMVNIVTISNNVYLINYQIFIMMVIMVIMVNVYLAPTINCRLWASIRILLKSSRSFTLKTRVRLSVIDDEKKSTKSRLFL